MLGYNAVFVPFINTVIIEGCKISYFYIKVFVTAKVSLLTDSFYLLHCLCIFRAMLIV